MSQRFLLCSFVTLSADWCGGRLRGTLTRGVSADTEVDSLSSIWSVSLTALEAQSSPSEITSSMYFEGREIILIKKRD